MIWLLKAMREIFRYPLLMVPYFILYEIRYILILSSDINVVALMQSKDLSKVSFIFFFGLIFLVVIFGIQQGIIWMTLGLLGKRKASLISYITKTIFSFLALVLPLFVLLLVLAPFLDKIYFLPLKIFLMSVTLISGLILFFLVQILPVLSSQFTLKETFSKAVRMVFFKSTSLLMYVSSLVLVLMVSTWMATVLSQSIPLLGPSILQPCLEAFFVTSITVSAVFFFLDHHQNQDLKKLSDKQ